MDMTTLMAAKRRKSRPLGNLRTSVGVTFEMVKLGRGQQWWRRLRRTRSSLEDPLRRRGGSHTVVANVHGEDLGAGSEARVSLVLDGENRAWNSPVDPRNGTPRKAVRNDKAVNCMRATLVESSLVQESGSLIAAIAIEAGGGLRAAGSGMLVRKIAAMI